MAEHVGDKARDRVDGGEDAEAVARTPIEGENPNGGAVAGRERRTSQRVPIEMWVEEITDGSQVFRRAGNLSRGGLFLDKTIAIPIGSEVKLRFTLPGDAAPIDVDAKIVSIEPEKELGMGVKFVSVDPGVQKRIDSYLQRLG
jgi:uncharacterized protein (TIGR02266 family)